MATPSFKDLGVADWLIRGCASIGIKSPTPIQANCIGPILAGKNCVGASKTGSGKTLAFAIPILQKMVENPQRMYALVLTATRELAFQIETQFAALGKGCRLKTCVIVGGMDWVKQGLELTYRPHIVIATPGRLADHLESCNTFDFSRIRFLVMDEADRLLSGNYHEQLKTICQHVNKERQNLCFSATITDVMKLLNETLKGETFVYEAPTEVATVDKLDQQYVLVPVDYKVSYFVQVLRQFQEKRPNGNIMVFTDTCKSCETISMTLNEVGFENVALHGMKNQKDRLAALSTFKSNRIKILIATDVAARGLDIPTVELVINYSLPKIPKEYVHRVGRTARAGRGGKALTIITPFDIAMFEKIEKFINVSMTEYKVDDREVGKIMLQVQVTKFKSHLKLDEKKFYEKKMIYKRKQWISDGLDPDEEEKKFYKNLKKDKKKRTKRKPEEKTDMEIQNEENTEEKTGMEIQREENTEEKTGIEIHEKNTEENLKT